MLRKLTPIVLILVLVFGIVAYVLLPDTVPDTITKITNLIPTSTPISAPTMVSATPTPTPTEIPTETVVAEFITIETAGDSVMLVDTGQQAEDEECVYDGYQVCLTLNTLVSITHNIDISEAEIIAKEVNSKIVMVNGIFTPFTIQYIGMTLLVSQEFNPETPGSYTIGIDPGDLGWLTTNGNFGVTRHELMHMQQYINSCAFYESHGLSKENAAWASSQLFYWLQGSSSTQFRGMHEWVTNWYSCQYLEENARYEEQCMRWEYYVNDGNVFSTQPPNWESNKWQSWGNNVTDYYVKNYFGDNYEEMSDK